MITVRYYFSDGSFVLLEIHGAEGLEVHSKLKVAANYWNVGEEEKEGD